MIPAKLRSNANWLILYKLNPVDFETVYRDAIVETPECWRQLIKHVFGDAKSTDETGYVGDKDEEVSMQDRIKNKRFDNLGIWVEYNLYFKNFKRIKC